MYNNITDELGMGAAKSYFDSRSYQGGTNFANHDPVVSANSLMTGLKLCLEKNYFKFKNKVYRQTGGVGTGVKLAPPYACLAVGEFDRQIFVEDPIPGIEEIKFWKRFIDDIFILFNRYRSNHPKPCKDLIVYCQALRIMERCSSGDLAQPHLAQRKEKFLERNYPEQVVDDQIGKAKSKERRTLIFKQRQRNTNNDKKVRLIFTNNEANPPIHQWLREGKRYLKSNKANTLGDQIQVVYKQPKNLQQLAGGANRGGNRTPRVEDRGCYKCNHCRVACPVIRETE